MTTKKNKPNPYLENLKEEILAFFAINGEQAFRLNDLFQHYDVRQRKEKMLYEILIEELIEQGKLHEQADGKFTIETQKNGIVGKIDHVNPRFAFIRYDDTKPDIWVDADDLNGAMDGDTVKATLYGKFYKKGDNPIGRVTEIMERGRAEIVGKVQIFGNYALVTPDSRKIHDDIFIEKKNINGATKDDLVIVKIVEFPTKVRQGVGEIIEILGKSGENNAEMHAIMAEFGLPVRFSTEIETAANAISDKISEEEIGKRRDMRKELTFTIDPADAKDFDDAISFKKLENGNYEIGVHIADVTHYVREGTILEDEAYNRATSVYLVDRCIPMLPEKLSNNLCSLRPHEDKLTFSAVFEMNEDAKVMNKWFGRTAIHSDRRFSYEEAQEVMDAGQSEDIRSNESLLSTQDLGQVSGTDYVHILLNINELAKKLREERFKKGAINFETNEVKFQLDETGKPLGVYLKVRKDAHKLIEEFMLLANKEVANFVFGQQPAMDKSHSEAESSKSHSQTSKPETNTMVYRVHEPPNLEKMGSFIRFAGGLGFTINTNNLSGSLNKLMANIEGTPVQNVLEQLAVRTMSKARYTTQPLGHFGLAFEHYSHFTSPIRRYPDMMAHRLLQNYLDGKKSPNAEEWETRCKHASDQEKLAAEAERASIKYKQVEYMSLQKEQIYDGVVTGVTDFGIFVEITENGCEGLVRMNDLTDDYYDLDKENYRIIGKRTGKVITFGDALQVRVKATDLDRRSMDLEVVGMKIIPRGGRSRDGFRKEKVKETKGKGERKSREGRKRRK